MRRVCTQAQRHCQWVDAEQQTWWQGRRASPIGCTTLSVWRDDAGACEGPLPQVLLATWGTGLMAEITLHISDEALVALKLSASEAGAEVRLAAAIKLFELGRLSSGLGASLAGIPRVLFLTKLAEYRVQSFQLSKDELEEDLANA